MIHRARLPHPLKGWSDDDDGGAPAASSSRPSRSTSQAELESLNQLGVSRLHHLSAWLRSG
jgi:hypothetical protein